MTTVLVVEDDATYRGALADALADAGFSALPAGGVRDALALARVQAPDLALVDLRLPDGSGVDVVRGLAGVAPGCRCVVLSGHGTIPAAVEAMRAGAVDFLTKPAEGPEIVAALKDAMEPEAVDTLDQVERAHILGVLQACGGNITEAARRLGLYRRTLQRKLQKLPPAR
jgi:two-component system response regulator RegA